jgi:hypothetical protein
MRIRRSRSVVTFRRAFFVSGVDDALPAGDYEIATDHELMESPSFLAYRRVATAIRLPGRPGESFRIIDVDPLELDALTERDARQTPPRGPSQI